MNMAHVSKNIGTASEKHASDIEKCLDGCKEKFNPILFFVINEKNQDAYNFSFA